MNIAIIRSDSRLRIEAVLKEATGPLSAEEVAKRAELCMSVTYTHLGNAVQKGRATNLNPGKRGYALYVWRHEKETAQHGERFVREGNYKGEASSPIRSGAMDAYSRPSIEGGVRVERRRPMLLGSSV